MNASELQVLMNKGWTYKERYIDKDFSKGLLGIRLTNAAKTWEEAYSIQIFNRTTVTLAQKANAKIDDHVSLTKDDGRDFLEWLRQVHPEVLSPETWNKLPEGEGETPAIASSDEARAALLQYVIPHYPEFFGPGGMAAAGAPLEATLLAILRAEIDEPETHRRIQTGIILAIEAAAHEFYKAANSCLRVAHSAPTPIAHLESAKVAYGYVVAADNFVMHAERLRGIAAQQAPAIPASMLPPAAFPEKIEEAEVWETVTRAMLPVTAAAAAAFVNARTPPATPEPPPIVYSAGMLVVVTDPNSPEFRQTAEVYRPMGADRYAVTFKSAPNKQPIFNGSQLKPLA